MKNIIKKIISKSGKPEDVLQRNLKDLNENIPKMNLDISRLKSKITSLNFELDKLKIEKQEFEDKKIISQGTKQESITRSLDGSLKRIQNLINSSEKDLSSIKNNYKKALNARNVFIEKKKKKINKSLSSLREYERKKWNDYCDKLMKGFEVEKDNSVETIHSEYHKNKINESMDIIDLLKSKSELIVKQEVKSNVESIILLSEKVLEDLKEHPDHLRKARMFLSYYLDATGQILSGYTDLCNEDVLSDNTKEMLLDAEKLLAKISTSFENFLKKLHELDSFKLDVELKVLEKTLKNRGLL
jgi:phage shock protein A